MHMLENKGGGGAGLDLDALVFKKVLSGYFLLHHFLERHAVYQAWAAHGMWPPLWPPQRFFRFSSEKGNSYAPCAAASLAFASLPLPSSTYDVSPMIPHAMTVI